jgi:GH18 family chitinase
MTYDLHGQWDAGNAHSQEGCDTDNRLRSQVNLTETKQSLAMITKAGVPGNKVIVGITSYGRSFSMAEAGCWGTNCLYTRSQMNSDATKGKCTNSAGYIADAEIAEIIEGKKRAGRVVKQFVDSSSNSDVLVYDDTRWVSYMSSKTKQTRSTLYSAWGLGGTTDWASDLRTYNDVPKPAKSWAEFKMKVKSGEDPKSEFTEWRLDQPRLHG